MFIPHIIYVLSNFRFHVNNAKVRYNLIMIKLIGNIPRDIVIACSGGPDSMAILDFLSKSKRKIRVLHFDHGTQHSKDARNLVEKYCKDKDIFCVSHEIMGNPEKGESLEAWWRNRRYEIINSLDETIVTGHNLNDVAEWWIFTALRGNPRLMPLETRNVIKPFILTEKERLKKWCDKNYVPYVLDPSNNGGRFARSRIRKNIMPHALDVAPGFLGTIRKMIKERYEKESQEKVNLKKMLKVI